MRKLLFSWISLAALSLTSCGKPKGIEAGTTFPLSKSEATLSAHLTSMPLAPAPNPVPLALPALPQSPSQSLSGAYEVESVIEGRCLGTVSENCWTKRKKLRSKVIVHFNSYDGHAPPELKGESACFIFSAKFQWTRRASEKTDHFKIGPISKKELTCANFHEEARALDALENVELLFSKDSYHTLLFTEGSNVQTLALKKIATVSPPPSRKLIGRYRIVGRRFPSNCMDSCPPGFPALAVIVDVPFEAKQMIEFKSDGTFEVTAACNTFNGSYHFKGTKGLEFKNFSSSNLQCALYEDEVILLSHLTKIVEHNIGEGDSVILK